MPTSTHTETADLDKLDHRDTLDHRDRQFAGDWAEWHAAHERHRADPHGFLAVTHLHSLGADPARLDGVPGTWSVENDAVRLVLAEGETLQQDGRELNVDGGATVLIGPIAERGGINLAAGDTVVELAKRGGEYIVRPRHPDNPLLREYQGTPAYEPDPAFAVEGTFVPFDEACHLGGRSRRGYPACVRSARPGPVPAGREGPDADGVQRPRAGQPVRAVHG